MPVRKGYQDFELDGMANTIHEASVITVKMKKDSALKKKINTRLKLKQEASKDLVVK